MLQDTAGTRRVYTGMAEEHKQMIERRDLLSMMAASVFQGRGAEPDWPQWRGPNRDGISAETGLLNSWPSSGPKLLWSSKVLGAGYGTVAIVKNRIYVQSGKGNDSVVQALNRADGALVWQAPMGRTLMEGRGNGPRSTPTVEGDRIYALSEAGDLHCLRAADGSAAWKKNILRDFDGSNPHWLISESPLIDGNNLIVTPGGNGNGVVAVNKADGKLVWHCKELSDQAGYASCIAANIGGVRAIMTLTSRAGVGVRATDGKLLWRYEKAANRTANCATPVFSGNQVFYTSAYGTGGGLVTLTPQGNEVNAEEAYFTRDMKNHHGGVILYQDHLYGFSDSILTCLEWKTGAVKWRDRSVGKGCLTLAGGKLFLLGEGHMAGLAEASPDGYKELGRFAIQDFGYPSWAHPVVCGGKLYIRNQSQLDCYQVAA